MTDLKRYGAAFQVWFIWVVLPVILGIATLGLRFTVFTYHWYLFANFDAAVLLLVLVLYCSRHTSDERPAPWFALLLEVPLVFLTLIEILDDPWINLQSAIRIHTLIIEDGGARGAVGILHALVGVYVFALGIRISRTRSAKAQKKELLEGLKSILGLSALFSLIVALGIFSVQSPYPISWTIRPILIIAGFIVGVFAVSLGVIFGSSENAFLLFIGGTLVGTLSFTMGVALIPFTGTLSTTPETIVFLAQIAFFSNTLLLSGVIAFLLSDNANPPSRLVMRLLR